MAIPYTKRDLESHNALGLVIRDIDGKILCFFHKKFNFWTIPLGKAEDGQSVEEAAQREAQEECGIMVTEVKITPTGEKTYHREGRNIVASFFICEILEYKGKISNQEPNKHSDMRFFSVNELKNLQETSDATKMFLKL